MGSSTGTRRQGCRRSRVLRPRLVGVSIILAIAAGLLCGSAAGAQDTNELTSFAQIKALTREAAGGGRAVRLRGVVVCYDAGWRQLYVHDGQETGYFSPGDFQTQPEIGQSVEITGISPGGNSLTNLELKVLGLGRVPPAKPLEISRLAGDHGEWIQTSGRLLSVETSRGRPALLLHDQGRNCLVFVLGSQATHDLEVLRDCRVRVRGINASKAVDGRLDSPTLFAPGPGEIAMLQPPTTRQAQVPVVSIGSLLSRELGFWTNQWVHVNGLTASYQPGRSLVVRDPTGTVRAQVIQLTEISGDERVDVWGFLRVTPEETVLSNAYFEVVHPPARDSAVAAVEPGNDRVAEVPALVTRIADLLKMRREEAARHVPVRLHGVVTYADADWRNGFLQDGGAAIYFDLGPTQTNVQPRQWIELRGVTSPGGFAPEVRNSTVEVLGFTNLPSPAKVDLEDLAGGHLDAHWVEMEGVVRRLDNPSGHLVLSLMTPKGRFKAIVPASETKPVPTQLIDALVSVQGACTSELNARGQLSGISLHAPNLDHIRILTPPSADPFALAATPIASVATFDPDRLAGRRVKVQGVVTLRLPGQGFILQDESAGLRVLTRQTNEVRIGDTTEVLGFPAIGDYSPGLEEAVFRRTGRSAPPAVKRTTADQILLHGANDAQLVELQARLLQSVPRSANPQLVLQDGPIIFTAHLQAQARPQQVPALPSGSLVRLAGVCAIQAGEQHEPGSFRLLLREPGDIELLQSPPWWTPRRAFMLAGGLMLAITIALAWVALLRRQVSTQTELIRRKLQDEAALEARFRELFENANDMVYTHDLEGRVTSINQTGERLLQRPRAQILSRHLVDLVVPEQQSAARQWLEQVLKTSAVSNVEWDFLAASGARVKLEISTRRIEEGGRLVEVEGVARDITERKRLEREILEISNREQRRIGHDLHDGVCQQLAGIAFMTSNLAEELEEHGAAQSTQAERISTLLHAVINQTRGVARGLFPVRLEENGLVSALEELAANAIEVFKIQCRFVCEEPPPEVASDIALHLYYIVLEAVANAARHAQARTITIRLEPAAGRYLLAVHDDGAGFANASSDPNGMGVRIMHYRARVIGATLSLQSRVGLGTDVACLFLPVTSEPPRPEANGKIEAGRRVVST